MNDSGTRKRGCRFLAAFVVVNALNMAYAGERTAETSRVEIKSVKLERTGCLGRCPSYTVEISSDYAVNYLGRYYVGKLGSQVSRINPSDFDSLVASIQKLNFFTLRDTYASKEDGCAKMELDAASILITVRTTSQIKRVIYDFGCENPEVLDKIAGLAGKIDEFAGTQQWVREGPVSVVELEPLVTESFLLRYRAGEDVVAILLSRKNRVLSSRGSAVVDKRDNRLFVQDTRGNLDKVRKIIKTLDVPGG